ncbi:MAG: Alpha/beta hydrolase [Rhodoglobus sp.]|nr:Alpha/beta hydrolase [Rhodoglobus sp.]
MPGFHPDLARGRFIPRLKSRAWSVRLMQHVKIPGMRAPEGMTIENVDVPGGQRVRVYRPSTASAPAPVLFWIHGGGFIQGAPEQDDRTSIEFARQLGIAVIAPSYRLAPTHPFPAPLDDVRTALEWAVENAKALGIDTARIAIGGASAGAGLAAGLVLRVHDEARIAPVFQLLVYPMLDDRTTLRTSVDQTYLRLWIPQQNHFGWGAYLGTEPGGPTTPEYAAPARRNDLTGLPPTWIGVGTNDLFHDEDLEYARRLREAGVPCEVTIVDGAFHGFDALFGKTEVAQGFLRAQIEALRPVLGS